MDIRFDGQIVLVTGAAQGNGRALALGFAQSGADVVIVDLRAEGAAETAAAVRASGRRAWSYALDIADRAACRATAARVEQEAGTITHLVNNAGIDGRAVLGDAEADKVWDAVINVNVNGLYNMTSAFVAQVVRSRGTILNVGSTMSFIGAGRMAAYTASKAAIHNFTQTLAIDLAPQGVRVNMLAPGLIETPLTAGLFGQPERLQGYLERTCLGRAGKPEEVVGPALLMCSSAASYMTGATVQVDGGWLAR